MIKYFGWIDIREYAEDCDPVNEKKLLTTIEKYISKNKLNEISYLARIHSANGGWHLLLSGGANHFNDRIKALFGLLEMIANLAKGSYGQMYFWNDENDENPNAYNEFDVYVLIRGKITKKKDTIFSPLSPTVED
ncbi:Imm7 family immunity protein [Saezia sanguinis]|uniref:Imm7 family immunity protein n=1 Tax=Saezia sanguinis TaxID=1965230 RepID=UPI00305807D3